MNPTTAPPSLTGMLAPSRSEAEAVLEKILAFSGDDKRFLLERLLRDILGDNPEGEWTVYDAPGKPYLHLLSPLARARLFITPERLAIWAAQGPGDAESHRQLLAMLERGDEDEVKAWLASRNA